MHQMQQQEIPQGQIRFELEQHSPFQGGGPGLVAFRCAIHGTVKKCPYKHMSCELKADNSNPIIGPFIIARLRAESVYDATNKGD